jgi:hypothetical protein
MRKRTWIKIFISACLLVFIVIIANVILKSVVEKKITTSLQQFQPYIKAGFYKAHVNLLDASVQLDSLFILYDPELKNQHIHQVRFSVASIQGIKFFKLVTAKKFSAGSLELSNANITIDHYLLDKKDSLPPVFFEKIDMPFKDIFFGTIEMRNAQILKKNGQKTDTITSGNITLSDVQIPELDSAFSKDSIRFSDLSCELNNINYRMNDCYAVHVKELNVKSKDSVMKINTVRLIPRLGKFEMGEKLGRQADHINASVYAIEVSGLDVRSLMKNNFIAGEINIKTPVAYVFRDRRLPRSTKKQPLPSDYLKQIPFNVNVQRLNVTNATVTSEEFPKEGDHSGYIKLENLSVTMKPFINRVHTSGKSSVTSNVKASIMGAGNIRATINLSLINGNSDISGFIEDLHLPALNPSAENLGRFHIESGVLNRLDFQFTATDTKATGKIVGVYHDLEIDRLKYTKHGLKKAGLPSFLLHHIIIPKNKDASLNVSKRTGKIDYGHDETRMVTFYYLKALLDGIRDSFAFGFVLPS